MDLSCSLYDASRFGCDSHTDAFRSLAPSRLHISQRYVFIGDSMTLQQYRSLACLVGATRPVAPVPINGTRESLQCVSGDGVEVCSAHASGHKHAASVATVCRALQPHLRRHDVLVLNEGVWWRHGAPDASWAAHPTREENRVFQLNTRLVAQLRRLGGRVFWRETTAQHFETEFGLWYARTTRPCRQVVNTTHLWARNARINRHLRRVNVSVLPALDLSLQYWAAHLERRTAYMRAMRAKPAADCTHFCEPSSLFARLNADLVAAVARGEG